MMLNLSSAPREWEPPIIKTIATEDEGVDMVVEKIVEHREYMVKSGVLASRRKERIRTEIMKIVENDIFRHYDGLIKENRDIFDRRLDDIVDKKEDPYRLAKDAVALIARKISEEAGK